MPSPPTPTTRPVVARIITRLNVGGPTLQARLLSHGLEDTFRTVLIAGSLFNGEASFPNGVKELDLVSVPALGRDISIFGQIRAFVAVSRLLARLDPAIVHTHLSHAGFHGRLAAAALNVARMLRLRRGHRIRTIHTFHGHVFRGHFGSLKEAIYIRLERLLARLSDRIVAISPAQARDLVEEFRIAPRSKVLMVPLGFDLSWTGRALDQAHVLRETLGLDAEHWLIGMVGRLEPVKNHRLFVDAFEAFCRTTQGAHAILVGDGRERLALEEHCRILGIRHRVHFVSWVWDPAVIYGAIDCLVLTSHSEGTPAAVIEAMASGVPVVATEVGGVPDLLGDPKTVLADGVTQRERGIGVRPGSRAALTTALDYIRSGDQALTSARATAQSYALTHHSAARLIADIRTVYVELLTSHRSSRP